MLKETKLEHYKICKSYLEENRRQNRPVGFCGCLPLNLTREHYPELYAYKPWHMYPINYITHYFKSIFSPFIDTKGYWFDPHDYKTRIEILEKIIKTMENETI